MKTVVPLCVLRSGSTGLSGVLHYLGVYMGKKKDLLKGQHVNKYGCFENQEFLTLSHKILYNAGTSAIYFDYPPDTKIKQAVVKNWTRVKNVIEKNQREPYWGWKDPSSFHIVPYLHQLLEDPHYIILKRDVNQIAKSIRKITVQTKFYSSISHELGLFRNHLFRIALIIRTMSKYFANGYMIEKEGYLEQVIENAYKKMEVFTADKKCLVIDFDDLIKNSEDTVDKVINFLDLENDHLKRQKAINFIHPELVNFSDNKTKNQ